MIIKKKNLNISETNSINKENNMTTTAKTIHLTRADFLKKVANFDII
jgi:hypothetical protein